MNTQDSVIGNAQQSLRAAPGSAYRLLGEKDVIQWDDEYLDDDCETWKRVNNQAGNGQSYSYRLHQPMRRVNTPNADLSGAKENL